jgi:hypothetical protein
MIKLKETIETKVSDKTVKLDIRRPNPQILNEGDKVYNKAFMEAYKSGAPLRGKIANMVKEQNLWDEHKEAELQNIEKEIETALGALAGGGIRKLDARKHAITTRRKRLERLLLLSERNALDNLSCEAQAEDKRFNYYVSACTVFSESGDPFFKSYDDYVSRSTEQAAIDAANKLATLIHNFDPDFQKKLPENEFLLKHNYCNEDLRLINKEGKLCDESFRVISEEGYYLDDKNERVDIDGNKLDEQGNKIVEFKPFLED